MPEEPLNHSQAFQQAIDTTITCRTLIKYNSNLSSEQKAEILAEIDTTLTFLEKRMGVNAGIEASMALSPEKLADLLITSDIVEDEIPLNTRFPADRQEEQNISIQNLYRLYRAYLSNEPGKGITVLETRYRMVMGVLDQLQNLTTLRQDVTASDLSIDGLLSRARGFVTAVYCMFREFGVLLAKIVEGQGIDMDTEALALLQKYPLETTPRQLVYDLAPLVRVYTRHLQLQQRRGPLHESARDTAAFLIFLEECLEQNSSRGKEIAAQIENTAGLLNEVIGLLMDYEAAVASIMQSPSTSP